MKLRITENNNNSTVSHNNTNMYGSIQYFSKDNNGRFVSNSTSNNVSKNYRFYNECGFCSGRECLLLNKECVCFKKRSVNYNDEICGAMKYSNKIDSVNIEKVKYNIYYKLTIKILNKYNQDTDMYKKQLDNLWFIKKKLGYKVSEFAPSGRRVNHIAYFNSLQKEIKKHFNIKG